MLYGPDGSPVAEFCDDQVTASAEGGDEQRWREWELELAAGIDPDLFDRLTNRLLDAGRCLPGTGRSWPGCWIERPRDAGEAAAVPADPVHRAVAEQVGELLEWDRAVRSDA